MAIQLPDPGTGVPADKTGDSPWLAMKKVRENFNDQTNAASRLVGGNSGNLLEAGFSGLAAMSPKVLTDQQIASKNFGLPTGFYCIRAHSDGDISYSSVLQMRYSNILDSQLVIKNGSNTDIKSYLRLSKNTSGDGYLKAHLYNSLNPIIYNTTTAEGANVVVTTGGEMLRSTSSERYKDILSPLELDDARYADAMALNPIVYRSTADADNPAYHYYSFSAEQLGARDPAFVLWRETETVTDDEGNTTEQPLAERQAEGININALLAMSHAIAIKQDKLIKALEARIAALEPKKGA